MKRDKLDLYQGDSAQQAADELKKAKRKSFAAKFRHGTTATVITIVFIAVVIGLNVFVGLASSRFPLKLDLTSSQIFTVSKTTEQFVRELDQPVELIVLGDEDTWRSVTVNSSGEAGAGVAPVKYVVETLDRYRELNQNVTVHYVDYVLNPGFFAERNNLPVSDGLDDAPVLIIYSPATGRYRYIRNSVFEDLQSVVLENRLNAGIRYTTREDMQLIGIVSGHGEEPLNYFETVMEDNGFDVESIVLAEHDNVPAEYQTLLICNPVRQYSDEDIRKLSDFLDNDEKLGKSLLVFGDLDMRENPKLESFLSTEWGMAFGTENIFDPDHSKTLSTQKVPLFSVEYSDDAMSMTGDLATGGYNLQLRLGKARSVVKTFESKDSIAVYTLLKTFDSAFSRYTASTNLSADALSRVEKETGDTTGPFDVGVMAFKTRSDGLDLYSSTVGVFGSTSLVNDYFISNVDGENQATAEYMYQMLQFMVAKADDPTIMISPVSLLSDSLHFENDAQLITEFVVTVAVIPAVFIVIGIVIWRRRKYL